MTGVVIRVLSDPTRASSLLMAKKMNLVSLVLQLLFLVSLLSGVTHGSAYRFSLMEESPGANGKDDRPRPPPPKGYDPREISTPP
ncbi:hypothetical protein NC653_024926 [Populus alba x Populus x berolinensis]|uniref:Uncharacterized protein n=1 Tax=Populus alba x Populus x berolinensis TaxID=444605 RepID=A0AAD6Q741_9ROSI|nr:hypothetical protein NC653_024926 [Populus alba x Populus x berolinensis]